MEAPTQQRPRPRTLAREILFRAGEAADLDTLLRIDLDASALFDQAGLHLDLPESHEFPLRERERIHASLIAGTTIVAMDLRGQPFGFIAVGRIDRLPYVEQLSVRMSHMRRGIGAALLDTAFHSLASRHGLPLWLTTYGHLPWNLPFYERNGFALVAEEACGAGIRRELEFQRRWLPQPALRVAMCRQPQLQPGGV